MFPLPYEEIKIVSFVLIFLQSISSKGRRQGKNGWEPHRVGTLQRFIQEVIKIWEGRLRAKEENSSGLLLKSNQNLLAKPFLSSKLHILNLPAADLRSSYTEDMGEYMRVYPMWGHQAVLITLSLDCLGLSHYISNATFVSTNEKNPLRFCIIACVAAFKELCSFRSQSLHLGNSTISEPVIKGVGGNDALSPMG